MTTWLWDFMARRCLDNGLQAQVAGYKRILFPAIQNPGRSGRYYSWARFTKRTPILSLLLFNDWAACFSSWRFLYSPIAPFSIPCSQRVSVDFKLSHRAFMKWYGVSGRTGSTTLELDLNVIESFHPDIVIMQLGSNDLTDSDPLHVGWAIDDFVRLLHDTFGVKVVCVYQTIMRQGAVVINHKA